ncbi:hypothetical protein F2Q69_00048347 [Brassica cretica]|uniref:Uncharacterized protein n=1 Tax=Brassica cretica TaxID=69181 RepID=A0A8S9PQX3_BRACR|nr:hypothetical protein F2Q69_00048347 [Brassica cretica]
MASQRRPMASQRRSMPIADRRFRCIWSILEPFEMQNCEDALEVNHDPRSKVMLSFLKGVSSDARAEDVGDSSS